MPEKFWYRFQNMCYYKETLWSVVPNYIAHNLGIRPHHALVVIMEREWLLTVVCVPKFLCHRYDS